MPPMEIDATHPPHPLLSHHLSLDDEENKKNIRVRGGVDDDHSHSSDDSPPHKQPRLIRLEDYKSKDLDKLKSEAAGIVELKDYVEWYNSVAAKDEEFESEYPFLRVRSYGIWYSTLDIEAKNNFMHPFDYGHWLTSTFDPKYGIDKWAPLAEKKANLALAHLKKMNHHQDYEYVSYVDIVNCITSFHLNFYARPTVVSPSSLPQQPEPLKKLFFAEVDLHEKVLDCSILDSQDIGDATILHPLHIHCDYCNYDMDTMGGIPPNWPGHDTM